MSTDNTAAFEADLEQSGSATDRRAELQAELEALDHQTPATTPAPASGAVEVPEDAAEGGSGATEPLHGEEFTFTSSALDGMEVTLWRPTDVAVTLFQQDSASQVLDDADRLGATGDFVREHMPMYQWREWQRAIKQAARRNPRIGGRVFYEAVSEALTALLEHVDETDTAEMDAALNRAQRRAALKEKQRQAKK